MEVFDLVRPDDNFAVVEVIDNRLQHVEVDVAEDERAFVGLIALHLLGEEGGGGSEHDPVRPDGESVVAGRRNFDVGVSGLLV